MVDWKTVLTIGLGVTAGFIIAGLVMKVFA